MSVILESKLRRPPEDEAFATLQIRSHFMLAQAKAGPAWRKSADSAYELLVRRASRLAGSGRNSVPQRRAAPLTHGTRQHRISARSQKEARGVHLGGAFE